MITQTDNQYSCPESNTKNLQAIKDSLELLNGKWKLPLIMVLTNGANRFNDIKRATGDITPKTLAKELREMELNELVVREVLPTKPVVVTYRLTDYCRTLGSVITELCSWGLQHRNRIMYKPLAMESSNAETLISEPSLLTLG